MGLDRDFLEMLTAPVVVERWVGADQWGNDTYSAPTTEVSFIDSSSVTFAVPEEGDRTSATPSATTSLLMDGIGIKPRDKITYDAIAHWVVNVDTAKDEFGADLFSTVTVSTTKRG